MQKSVVTYEDDPYPHEILHIKCYVIQFIREQMEKIRGRKPPIRGPTAAKSPAKVPEKETTISRSPEEHDGPPCKPWGWLQWLLLYLLLLLMFLYGAIIGANFCQNKRYYSCHPLYPLAGFGRKGHEVVF